MSRANADRSVFSVGFVKLVWQFIRLAPEQRRHALGRLRREGGV